MSRVRVVAAVICRDGRYLLGKRPEEKRHGGLWEFPGGKMDEGESPADAAARELREELDLSVASVGAKLAAFDDEDSPFVIEFHEVFVAGEPVAHEHEELRWFAPAELRQVALAPADHAFARLLERRR